VWGSFLLLVPLGTFKINLLGLLWVFMALISIGIEGSFWDELARLLSWWSLLWCIGGNFLMPHISLARDQEKPISTQSWESFFISFLSRPNGSSSYE
jgi:hypothetical protein